MDVGSSATGGSIARVTVLPDREPEVLFWADNIFPPWVTSPRPPSNVDPDQPFWPFQGITLTELFASFDDVFRRSVEIGSFIRARYNERYHFPEEMYNGFPGGANGGGISFSITNFEDLRNSND